MQYQGDYEVRSCLEGFEEVIPLTDENSIGGGISLIGNDIEGKAWGITLTDLDTGEVKKLQNFDISFENEVYNITDADMRNYSLELKFRRGSGRKGFKLLFGKQDDKNHLMWEFGGWDNWDCNLTSIRNGRGSTISHRIFHVEDKEYGLRLVIQGRHIRTYVNGELYNDAVDHLPELEEIYVAASKEEGRVIVKAVNLTGEEKKTHIAIEGSTKHTAVCHSLRNCSLMAENTLDEPDKVAPVTEQLVVSDNAVDYDIPPHSVNVLVFE